jgi:hypothetical protein
MNRIIAFAVALQDFSQEIITQLPIQQVVSGNKSSLSATQTAMYFASFPFLFTSAERPGLRGGER